MTTFDPYKRLHEISKALVPLEQTESVLKNRNRKRNDEKKYQDVTSEIFFLTMEEITIKKCVEYFEAQRTKDEKTENI